jgi:hypothetical protein
MKQEVDAGPGPTPHCQPILTALRQQFPEQAIAYLILKKSLIHTSIQSYYSTALQTQKVAGTLILNVSRCLRTACPCYQLFESRCGSTV